jgi:hypothetical protein
MCSLKSLKVSSVVMFDPADLLTRQPFSTFQLDDLAGLSKVQPAKSSPLNNLAGVPHFGFEIAGSNGARLPVQVQAAPFGPLAEPAKLPPVNFALECEIVFAALLLFRGHEADGFALNDDFRQRDAHFPSGR